MADANEVNSGLEKSVKFMSTILDRTGFKQHPTQKYNRKEVQKRLVVEAWMDEQLRYLYNCTSDQDKYPEIDLDDIVKLEPHCRYDYIQKSLLDAKHSIDAFIIELLSRVLDISPLS